MPRTPARPFHVAGAVGLAGRIGAAREPEIETGTTALLGASGADVDRMMVEHRRSAVAMAETEVAEFRTGEVPGTEPQRGRESMPQRWRRRSGAGCAPRSPCPVHVTALRGACVVIHLVARSLLVHTHTLRWAHAARYSRLSSILVALAVVPLLAGCSNEVDQTTPGGRYEFTGATEAGQVVPPSDRADAPSFDGELLDGTPFRSTELAGDVSVINFWGSWCAPCRVETPDLQAVYEAVRDDGVQFLGVDVKDERQLASAFMSNVGAEYPSLFDPRGEVALAFRGFPANVVPSTILLDSEGRVAAVYTGAIARDDLRAALTVLVGEDA